MRKNGTRLISIGQYRMTDLFLFAVILVTFDILAHFAPIWFPGAALFTFTLTVPMTLLVMMRWGWPSVFFAVGDGILLSVLNNTAVWQSYVSFGIGCAFICVMLAALKIFGKEKISGKWYFSAAFTAAAWIFMNLGITLVQTVIGGNFVSALATNFGLGANGLMPLAIALLIILVMRRLDGMFEDQKHYLLRLDKERKEKMRRDTYGDEPVEIDDESLSILGRNDEDWL